MNGLCHVLDDTTKGAVSNGYLTPRDLREATLVIKQLRENGHKLTYLCVANTPIKGERPVHLILAAAPAFGRYRVDYHEATSVPEDDQAEIQFLCALHAYRAQFAQCVALAKKEGKPVIFKTCAVGLGAFGNDPQVVAKAFYQAATEWQGELKSNNVQVRFQIFRRRGGKMDEQATKFATALGLQEYKAPQAPESPS